jgi:hypothetical protein
MASWSAWWLMKKLEMGAADTLKEMMNINGQK